MAVPFVMLLRSSLALLLLLLPLLLCSLHLRGGGVNVLFGAEHSSAMYSQHLVCLQVSSFTAITAEEASLFKDGIDFVDNISINI